jgi:LmbE family N-acetylglucosaminyl deacetylase
MTTGTATNPEITRAFIAGPLASAVRVLAVTARPGQESADLGGLLYAFRQSGASLSLLCLTRGEGPTQSSGTARLEAARTEEVQMAASILGVRQVAVAGYRDGILHHYRTSDLAGRIRRAVSEYSAGFVLVVAPEAGDIGDRAVAHAATAAALLAGVPVAARTTPGVPGAWTLRLGADAEVARSIQKSAAAAHTSQSEALPMLIKRLDQLGSVETIRWLVSPGRVPAQRVGHEHPPPPSGQPPSAGMPDGR